MFLKNVISQKSTVNSQLRQMQIQNHMHHWQIQIQMQIQGGVLTFSGIYCQTATGAKRSAVPFIPVAAFRALVSVVSAFGRRQLVELSSIGQSRIVGAQIQIIFVAFV